MVHEPPDKLFFELLELVARTFRVGPRELDRSSGPGSVERWDSLGHIELMMAVETQFKVRFSIEQIAQMHTIEKMCEVLKSMGVTEQEAPSKGR